MKLAVYSAARTRQATASVYSPPDNGINQGAPASAERGGLLVHRRSPASRQTMKARLWLCRRWGAIVSMCLVSRVALARIPGAPSIPGGSTSDFMKTGQGVFNEGAGIMMTALYIVSIMGYCSGVVWLLAQSKKTKEWGNFFKGTGIGLAVLVLVLILLNQAKTALGS